MSRTNDNLKGISIKKNFVMNSILQMSSFLFPLISYPYVARILKPTGNGKVSFAISLISYFSIFAQLGIPTYGIRACSKVRDNKIELTRTAHELLFINLFMSVFTYICFALSLLFIPKLKQERLLYIIVSSTILLNSLGMEWLFKGLEQYAYITIRSLVFKFIALIAMFIFIHNENDYVIYGLLSILAASASNILNFFHAHRFIEMKYVHQYNPSKHIKQVMIFFAMACATTIYTNLDTVMLGFMTSDTDVGYYNSAVKIKNVLISLVASLGAVLLPRNSYYVEHKMWNEFKRVSQKALEFVFVVAMPLFVYFIFFAAPSIKLLSGIEYDGAIIPMKIIMPTLLFIGVSNILGLQILVPLGKEKIVLYSEIAGAVVDLVLNLFLIPIFKSSGAAIGTLVAEFVVLIVQFFAINLDMKIAFKKINYLLISFGIILGTVCSIWLLYSPLNNFLMLATSCVLFFGVYFITLLIGKEPLVCSTFEQLLSLVRKQTNNKIS